MNINDIVVESLSDHLEKHWKKYALGLGSAALASGGYFGYKKYQDTKNKKEQLKKAEKNTQIKKVLKKAGLAAAGIGAAGIVAHQAYNKFGYERSKKNLEKIEKEKSNFYRNEPNNADPMEHLKKSNEFDEKWAKENVIKNTHAERLFKFLR